MARPTNDGWDFVEEGKQYQYKETGMPGQVLIAMVTIIEDQSDNEFYKFKARIDKATEELASPFTINHRKIDGIYSGMPQLYEGEEYVANYTYVNDDA